MSLHTVLRGLSSLLLIGIAGFANAAVVSESRADQSLTEQVQRQLAQHADLGTQLTVHTRNGVVYLAGSTGTGYSKSNAEDVARQVPGVIKVVDMASSDCG